MRDINPSFLGYKLQNAAVGREAGTVVAEFEQHRVGDVESRQFLEGRGWHDDLPAVFHLHALLVGENHRVAAELLPEPAHSRESQPHTTRNGVEPLIPKASKEGLEPHEEKSR